MNSNTLETDAACKWWLDNPVVDATFARKLERERDEARKTCAEIDLSHRKLEIERKEAREAHKCIINDFLVMREGMCKLREVCDELAAALKAQDDHHSESCVVFFEQDGKPIEISTDLGEAYQESELCEKTGKAISNYKSIKK